MPPRLSAIICTYQRYHVLAGAIQSLLTQSLAPGELEIIVVDNSPDQAAAAAFGAQYNGMPQLRYILESTAGLSNARNLGLALATAKIAGFIDDDAIAEPDWAAAILTAFTAFGPKAGAVGGIVRPIWQSEPPVWLAKSLWAYLSLIDRGGAMRAFNHRDAIAGCNMALDRELALALGGFTSQLGRIGDDTILLSNEEAAFFMKMLKSGRSMVYTPDAVVGHIINTNRLTQPWFRRRAAWQAVSDFIMDPKGTAALAVNAASYLHTVEEGGKRLHNVRFFGEVENAEMFADEIHLIRQLTLVTLQGGAEMPRHLRRTSALTIKKRFQNFDFTRKFPLSLRAAWRRLRS